MRDAAPQHAAMSPCSRCGHDRSEHEYEASRETMPDGSIEEEYWWGPCEVYGCDCGGWLPKVGPF